VTDSRAVERTIEPGNAAICPQCGLQVKFQARTQGRQVICNIYTDGKWDRVEHFHTACYTEAGEPFGPPAS
jgi:hypothetical protein